MPTANVHPAAPRSIVIDSYRTGIRAKDSGTSCVRHTPYDNQDLRTSICRPRRSEKWMIYK